MSQTIIDDLINIITQKIQEVKIESGSKLFLWLVDMFPSLPYEDKCGMMELYIAQQVYTAMNLKMDDAGLVRNTSNMPVGQHLGVGIDIGKPSAAIVDYRIATSGNIHHIPVTIDKNGNVRLK